MDLIPQVMHIALQGAVGSRTALSTWREAVPGTDPANFQTLDNGMTSAFGPFGPMRLECQANPFGIDLFINGPKGPLQPPSPPDPFDARSALKNLLPIARQILNSMVPVRIGIVFMRMALATSPKEALDWLQERSGNQAIPAEANQATYMYSVPLKHGLSLGAMELTKQMQWIAGARPIISLANIAQMVQPPSLQHFFQERIDVSTFGVDNSLQILKGNILDELASEADAFIG